MADLRQLAARFRSSGGAEHTTVLVIGLGRFGSALAQELVAIGHEVMGVDVNDALVNRHKDLLTDVRTADCTEVATLEALGAPEIPHAVVGIGLDMEASILTTSALSDAGVDDIWAKALTERHRQILKRVGADHTVLPEAEMGRRVAHLITGTALSYIEIDEDFVIVETAVPKSLAGHRLAETDAWQDPGLTIIAIRRPGGPFVHAQADDIAELGDILLASGRADEMKAFTERP